MTVCAPIGSCGRFESGCRFGAAPDCGVAHRTAVYGGVGADFHIVAQRNRARLRDFEPMVARKRQPEAKSAPMMLPEWIYALAQRAAVVNGYVGVQYDLAAERAIVFHHAVGQMRHCSPNTVRAPMYTFAPISQLAGTRAVGSITAVGWMPA